MSVNPSEEKQFKEELFLISVPCNEVGENDHQSKITSFFGPLLKSSS
jgi:hypothetical protein